MGMSKFEILQLFHKNLLEFLDILIIKLPSETDLINLRVLFNNTIPIEKAMEIFSKRILPCEDMVLNQDEAFFLEGTDLFEGVKSDKVNYFKNLWSSPSFNKDDKESLWKWFKLFLKLAKLYSK
jgi:hypothetical protein